MASIVILTCLLKWPRRWINSCPTTVTNALLYSTSYVVSPVSMRIIRKWRNQYLHGHMTGSIVTLLQWNIIAKESFTVFWITCATYFCRFNFCIPNSSTYCQIQWSVSHVHLTIDPFINQHIIRYFITYWLQIGTWILPVGFICSVLYHNIFMTTCWSSLSH